MPISKIDLQKYLSCVQNTEVFEHEQPDIVQQEKRALIIHKSILSLYTLCCRLIKKEYTQLWDRSSNYLQLVTT